MRNKGIPAGLGLAALLLSALFLFLQVGVSAAQPGEASQQEAALGAAEWLVLTHQNEDGGYASFSTGAGNADSDVGGTVDALLALAAAGYNAGAPFPGRTDSPIAYLLGHPEAVTAYATRGGGPNGKLILALVAAGEDPRSFVDHNFAISLTEQISPTGQYNATTPFDQSLALLAHSAVSPTVPQEGVNWLLERQAQEGDLAGSWDDGFGTDGNIDATALAIQALLAADIAPGDPALIAAREFLASAQTESGGWAYAPGFPESANSTALALQALSALGEDFYSGEGEWAPGGVSPLAALLAWQGESGAFQADFGDGRADDFFTTVQALPAVTGKPYPLPGRYEGARRGLACLASLQDPDSGAWSQFAGTDPNAGGTSRAIQAIVAAGADPEAPRWTRNGTTPLDALAALTPAYLEEGRGGRVGIVIQGVEAAGGDATDFAGYNLPLSLTAYLSPTGEYAATNFGPAAHAEAMLGLLAAGEAPANEAVTWLLEAQAEGDWGGPDANGLSLQVLGRLDEEAVIDAIAAGVAHLHASQQVDGGWGFGLPSSPNSTAEVGLGLVTAGENPFDPTWSQVVSGTLYSGADRLLAQQGDNGCWPNLFGPGDDPFATTDAILLLAQNPAWGTVSAMAGDVATEVAVAATATETPAPAATPLPTATPEPEPSATPAPAETAVSVVTQTPAPTPEPDLTGAGEEDVAEDIEEVEGTDPAMAWILLAAAAFLVIGTAIYVYVREG